MIKHYLLLICLGISVRSATLEKQASARLAQSYNYIDTFFNVDNVPQEFNDTCRKELDCRPENVPGANHHFYFQVASVYGGMSVYHPDRISDCERIKRYYQTIVSHAFENKIDVFKARDQVNQNTMLLGYVCYGHHNASIELKQWQIIWTGIKQKVGPGGDIVELQKK
jgi:hypothetical protein